MIQCFSTAAFSAKDLTAFIKRGEKKNRSFDIVEVFNRNITYKSINNVSDVKLRENNKNKNETEQEYRFKLVRKSTDEYLKKFLDQDVNQSKSRELWCAICLEEMSGFDKIRQLKCSHHFHRDCIEHWLAKNLDELSCPLCRTSLYPPLEEEEKVEKN